MQKLRKHHVHFVGIGGIGVSSLARYFLENGYTVSGSDSSACEELELLGIKVFQGHDLKNLPEKIDLLVYSNAVPPDNPEIIKAKSIGIKIKSYPEALGDLTKKYYTIAISGTHGKSTTTAMLSLIMIEAGLDPTVIIGTKLKEFDHTNFRKGNSKYLLIEADEFKKAFLNYYPQIAVVTNIEKEHLEFYKNINNILFAFEKYVKNNLKEGTLVLNKDNKNSLLLENKAKGSVVKYSLREKLAKKIKLSIPGKHNLSNSLAAFRVGEIMGIDEGVILRALSKFTGTWRRFDEKTINLKNGKSIVLINDYAHHPTEVRATIQAVNEKYPDKKVIAVFQPHQYERTYRLFPEFKEALSSLNVQKLLISDIYTVEGRESETTKKKINSEILVERTKNTTYTGNINETGKYLLKYLQGNEIVVIMGAGDVYKIENILKKGL